MKYLGRILPHVTMILSVVFIVFLILDEYNPTMNFINNDISPKMLVALCVSAFASAVLLIAHDRRKRQP